jgi:phospholipid/cholesterol/gamma-HCH transport system permease protein
MSSLLWMDPRRADADADGGRLRRFLAGVGRAARRRTRFTLLLAALSLGVLRDAAHPLAWRRTVRAEFRRALRQSVGGGLSTVLITAALIGVAAVNQALFWLSQAGQESLIGAVLVNGLVRGLGPVLVGLILLGRSGMVALSEIGALSSGGQIRALEAQGLDPFQLLLLPRACAFALASFTLTVMFVATALTTGFVAENLLQGSTISFWSFLDRVLHAIRLGDFLLFPAKTIAIGLLVALAAALTGLEARRGIAAAELLPRGFVRGVLVILFVNVFLTLMV